MSESNRNKFDFVLRQIEDAVEINDVTSIYDVILARIATIISTCATTSNKMLLITVKPKEFEKDV